MSQYFFHSRMCNSVPPLLLLLLVAIASLLLRGGVALNIMTGYDSILKQNQYLNDSDYYMVLQEDCNLVITYQYQGYQTWASNTNGTDTDQCVLRMQKDGNLVLYKSYNSSQHAIWGSATVGGPTSHYYFILTKNGSLNIYNFATSELVWEFPSVAGLAPAPPGANPFIPPHHQYHAWTPTLPLDGFPYMPVGYYLSEGSSLQSEGGKFNLTLENGCNLRSKDNNGKILWEAHTNGSGTDRNCQLILPQNGNVQIQNGQSDVIWESNAIGNSSVNWVLYVDGNHGTVSVVDIFQPNNTLWTTARGTKFSVKGLVIGVIGGCFLIGITALAMIYYAFSSGTAKAERELRRRLQNNGGKSQELSLAKIRKATKNFQEKIGAGGFGDVFYGRLADGQEVAVKVLSATSHQSKEEFFNEIELLSVVHHKYLVSLVGYCIARNRQILVYEYMSGGDLRARLQGESATKNPLSWKQRKNIILQVAKGIEYLHDRCVPSIIHRDIKSNNILLSEKLVAKVADFGLSKLRAVEQEGFTHITTLVRGTPGYLDPEYHETGKLTEKSDVYAFGVVLMEIFTGYSQLLIVHKVIQAWQSKQLDGLIDPNLHDIFNRQEFSDLVKLSILCTMKESSNRPSMPQVVQMLQKLGLEPLEYEAKGDDESLHIQMACAFESEILDEKETNEIPILSSVSISSPSTNFGEELCHQSHGSSESNATNTIITIVAR